MKKTFLAMLLLGGTMTVFAQTDTSTMNNNTTTNATMNNTTSNNASWSGSTSWSPETTPYWGWTTYPVWYARPNNGMNTTANMDASASMNSTSANMAYGVAVPNLPANVQMRFNQDFPNNVNNTYTWNQYGDWFHTYYMGNGRLTQYFYDTRGNGYSLALPVIESYVPEDVIEKALNKYGSNLYSIGMVKTADGNNTYQIGLIRDGQMSMQYLDENGVSINNIWRTDEMDSTGNMNSMQSNAAMDNGTMNMNNQSGTDMNMNMQSNTNVNQADANSGKTKIKIKNADGSETKIKTKDGETKVKHDPATNNNQ